MKLLAKAAKLAAPAAKAATPVPQQAQQPPQPSPQETPAALAETVTGMKLEQAPGPVVEILGVLPIAAIALHFLFPLPGAWRPLRKTSAP